jgi:hypothetical protein
VNDTVEKSTIASKCPEVWVGPAADTDIEAGRPCAVNEGAVGDSVPRPSPQAQITSSAVPLETSRTIFIVASGRLGE